MEDLAYTPDDVVSEVSDFLGQLLSPCCSCARGLQPVRTLTKLTIDSGSEETKALYEERVASYSPMKYWAVHHWNVQVIAARGKKRLEKAGKPRSKSRKSMPKKSNVLKLNDEPSRETTTVAGEDNDADMNLEGSTLIASSSAKDRLEQPQNYYEGQTSAKQLGESVADFLARLPPSRATVSEAEDAWIWICNPHPNIIGGISGDNRRGVGQRERSGDVATFRQLGERLKEKYLTRKTELENENPDKGPGQITRLLRDARISLESDIKQLAVTQGVTHGKWMLFPHEKQVDKVWSIVAHAVWEGKLGTAAKVAVAIDRPGALNMSDDDELPNLRPRSGTAKDSRDQSQRLICIYTPDFTDRSSILAVLRSIKDLGLINANGLPLGTQGVAGSVHTIYYKCDAYTYLDILGGNEFKLKASLFSSKDLAPDWYPTNESGRR
jgi:hypothetical protein